jgi:hypothetical protein
LEEFDPDEPIISQVTPSEWDQERSVAYEVALEIIGDVIGAISGILYHEKRKERPDLELIARLSAERGAAARAQDDLPHDDWDQIRNATRSYAARLRELDVLLQERIAGA